MMERKDHFVIGFCILKVEDNRKYRMHHLNPSRIIAKVRFVSIIKSNVMNFQNLYFFSRITSNQNIFFYEKIYLEEDTYF